MADNTNNPDSEAKKWFALALIGTLLYVATVFVFVITADPGGPQQAKGEVQEHGQSH